MRTSDDLGKPENTGACAPWSLDRLPNFDATRSVSSVHARDLDTHRFADIVRANRPCVIDGAIDHWPALEAWRDPRYLVEKLGADTRVAMIDAPHVELLGLVLGDGVQARIEEELAARAHRQTTFGQFVDEFERAAPEQMLYLYSKALEGTSPYMPLLPDVGGFSFVEARNRLRFYPLWRVFLGRGYTDWHYHPGQEAIMTQVVGTKRVALLPPDRATWNRVRRVMTTCMYRYGVDLERFPEFGEIEPIVVTVRPGQSLFIPIYWWHCVESTTPELGATVALSFDARPAQIWNPRLPASYYTVRAAAMTLSPSALLEEAWRTVSPRRT